MISESDSNKDLQEAMYLADERAARAAVQKLVNRWGIDPGILEKRVAEWVADIGLGVSAELARVVWATKSDMPQFPPEPDNDGEAGPLA